MSKRKARRRGRGKGKGRKKNNLLDYCEINQVDQENGWSNFFTVKVTDLLTHSQ